MKDQCIICEADLPASAYEKRVYDTRFGILDDYSIKECLSCGLLQTVPVPTQDRLNTLYEKYYNFGGERHSRYTSLRATLYESSAYKLWLKVDGDIAFHLKKGVGKLLDVGCNEGRGLEFFRDNGFEAEGLELNANAASVARSKGFVVHNTTLEEFSAREQYDVIVLSNVLEHSLAPLQMLGRVYSMLKPDGEVWISCPNSNSWLRTVFGRYWINWHVPFHIAHFSSDSLRELLAISKLSVVDIAQKTPALWVAHSLIARFFAKQGLPTQKLRSAPLVASLILLARVLMFPILWLGDWMGRGDCLVVVARKQ